MFSKLNLFVAAACVSAVAAAPQLVKRVTDTDILNFALTLEYLESNFYTTGLAKYGQDGFNSVFPPWVYERFMQIQEHESTHVKFLAGALGSKATQPCTYTFPHTDPASFAALSQILEAVGTSAYLGAAALITDPGYLTAAGSILTVEARHDAWVASAVNQGPAWDTAFGTPLNPNGVFSLAGQFISDCPSSNPALPVMPLPALTVSPANPAPGDSITLTAPGVTATDAWFFSGLQTLSAPVDSSGKATIPDSLALGGIVFVTLSNGSDANATMLSGAGILNFIIPADADVSTS